MKREIYSYQVNFLPDEGGYTATVPTLAGCVSFGKTIEEATKNAEKAIKLHLECLKAHKKRIPNGLKRKPLYSTFIQVTLPYAR